MKRDIRFLVTNCCNYGCYFCHHEGVSRGLFRHDLTVENYVLLYNIYKKLEDWDGVTLSGGEPLMFHGIDALVEKLHAEGAEITIVTNGSLLGEHLLTLRFVKRINVSIHTMDEKIYEMITNRKRIFRTVLDNLKMVRGLYPNIEIRLNVTPCKSNGWDIEQLKSLIRFAKEIGATIKCTELFPNTDKDNCISIAELENQLASLGYSQTPNDDRTMMYKNAEGHSVFLTQCTCSKAVTTDSPIAYCRQTHDLYINHDGTIPLCRLGKEQIDLWEEIEDNEVELISKKMEIAMRKVSREKCNRYLKGIY